MASLTLATGHGRSTPSALGYRSRSRLARCQEARQKTPRSPKAPKTPKKDDKKIILSLAKCFQLLGINLNKNNDESNFVTKSEKKIIFDLIQEREAARKLKDFERADNIRDKLKKMNITIINFIKRI